MDFKPESLIIERPDLVTPSHKMTALGITLFFWGVLLYLWQPLLSLVAWGLNLNLFYNHMILLGGYRTFLALLLFYATVVALLGGGLILWARINQWRFRGRERRRDIGTTDHVRLAASFGLAVDTVAAAMQSRIVTVSVRSDGCVEAMVPTARVADAKGMSDQFTADD
jgi:biofilm PGA synthesis protein PgaD